MKSKLTSFFALALTLGTLCATLTSCGGDSTKTAPAAIQTAEPSATLEVTVAPMSTPAPSPTPEVTEATVSETPGMADGRVWILGRWEQDGDRDNGPEELVWRMAEERAGLTELVTASVIDCQPYEQEFLVTGWAQCGLRRWLLSDFLHTAFSAEEAALLCPEPPLESYISRFATVQPEQAQDLVSIPELSRARGLAVFREAAEPTAWALARGAAGGGQTAWWMRQDGYEHDEAPVAVGVDLSGMRRVDDRHTGVRPCVWIRTEDADRLAQPAWEQ